MFQIRFYPTWQNRNSNLTLVKSSWPFQIFKKSTRVIWSIFFLDHKRGPLGLSWNHYDDEFSLWNSRKQQQQQQQQTWSFNIRNLFKRTLDLSHLLTAWQEKNFLALFWRTANFGLIISIQLTPKNPSVPSSPFK